MSDLNVKDLGFFASLKSRVWGMNASSIDELVETIFDQYEKNDGDTMERVWQSLFKVYLEVQPNTRSDGQQRL